MNSLAPLTIADISIRQDSEGRYNLNDLHKAAGGEAKHRPNYFLKNQQTIELIEEMEIAEISAIQSKQGLGTFVVEDLVYAYAMWISAAFTLKIIRAYRATQELQQVRSLKNSFKIIEPPTITQAQQGEIITLAADKTRATGKHSTYFLTRFKNHFKLSSYKNLPAERFQEAMEFLRRLEGEDKDSFIMLSHKELNGLIKAHDENPDRGEALSKTLNNSITLTLAPTDTVKRWLVTQTKDETVMLTSLNNEQEVITKEAFIGQLIKEGYLVIKKTDVMSRLGLGELTC